MASIKGEWYLRMRLQNVCPGALVEEHEPTKNISSGLLVSKFFTPLLSRFSVLEVDIPADRFIKRPIYPPEAAVNTCTTLKAEQ